jgi:hypothetical protein
MLYVQGEARKGAKPHSVDTGETARSIEAQLAPGPTPLSATVFTRKLYAPAVEFGRRPGKQPPVDAIAPWVRRHGIDAPAFVIARAIGRRGTQGLFFMRQAAEAGRRRIGDFLRASAREMQTRWPR